MKPWRAVTACEVSGDTGQEGGRGRASEGERGEGPVGGKGEGVGGAVYRSCPGGPTPCSTATAHSTPPPPRPPSPHARVQRLRRGWPRAMCQLCATCQLATRHVPCHHVPCIALRVYVRDYQWWHVSNELHRPATAPPQPRPGHGPATATATAWPGMAPRDPPRAVTASSRTGRRTRRQAAWL